MERSEREIDRLKHPVTQAVIRAGRFLLLVVAAVGLWSSIAVADYLSNWEEYRRIRLGMSRQEVRAILKPKRIVCGVTGVPQNAATMCRFNDFWRDYHIGFDGATGNVVVRKQFWFRERSFF